MVQSSQYMKLADLDHNSQKKRKGTYSRDFNFREQNRRLFKEHCPRLVVTGLFVLLLSITLYIYQQEGSSSYARRNGFNAVTIILTLALGLNFFEAFKDVAKVARWKILAHGMYKVGQMDDILRGDSLMRLLRLMYKPPRSWSIGVMCAIWIAANLLAQGALAILALTWSFDKGHDSTSIVTTLGNVAVPRLNCYYNFNGSACADADPKFSESVQTIAHSYGEDIRSENRCISRNVLRDAGQACYYYSSDDSGSVFTLQYRQYNPDDQTRSYPYLTPRLITSSSGPCLEYNKSEPNVLLNGTNGPESLLGVPYHNDTYNGTLNIPRELAGWDATTYIWNDNSAPQASASLIHQACGERCLWIWAFRQWGPATNRTPAVFKCPISISEVTSANSAHFHTPGSVARLAAASIALNGRYSGKPPPGPGTHWFQAQFYPYGSYWDTNGLSAQQVGNRMAEFAIGSLARVAELNPTMLVVDTQPVLGYVLDVQWQYYIPLVVGIIVFHALLLGLMLWSARRIVVVDESYLALTRLMGRLVFGGSLGGNKEEERGSELQSEGCLLDDAELASAIEERIGSAIRISYWAKMNADGTSTLVLGQKPLGSGQFLDGTYT